MRVNKEGETVIFEYERKHLKPGDKERIVSAYREHSAALSRSKESGNEPETELSLLLASLVRTPEELARLLAIGDVERKLEELRGS